jgi:hypothetical protein
LWLNSLPFPSHAPPAEELSKLPSEKVFQSLENARKFFQSLENSPHFSNHWKNIFQSLENPHAPAGLPDCAKPKSGSAAPSGEVRLDCFADQTRFDNRIETAGVGDE